MCSRVLNCTFKGFGAQTATEYKPDKRLYQTLEKIDNATKRLYGREQCTSAGLNCHGIDLLAAWTPQLLVSVKQLG
jgi:hypothetical protein